MECIYHFYTIFKKNCDTLSSDINENFMQYIIQNMYYIFQALCQPVVEAQTLLTLKH